MVSMRRRLPRIEIFGLFVTPSWSLTPLSGLIPVMTGLALAYGPLPLEPSA